MYNYPPNLPARSGQQQQPQGSGYPSSQPRNYAPSGYPQQTPGGYPPSQTPAGYPPYAGGTPGATYPSPGNAYNAAARTGTPYPTSATGGMQNIPPGYPPQPGTTGTYGTGGAQKSGFPPYNATYPPQQQQQMPSVTASNQGQWYSGYYSQISPQEMTNLQAWFARVDTDHSGTIEAEELQHVTFDNVPLGIEVARKLVQVFDKDRNGKIEFFEYASMHKFISHMRQAFLIADTDRSGRIEAREILQALNSAGFNFLSMGTINELLRKFDRTQKGLDWREFLLMLSHIANVHSVFSWNDTQKRGSIVLTEDQLTHISAYLI